MHSTSAHTPRPRVAILGGGFGGLAAARVLGRAEVEVTLVDRHNYHAFQPLLYQVATAGLSAPDIGAPIRRVLRRFPNTRVLMAQIHGIAAAERVVRLAGGELSYDYLIVATGATHAYFGHDEWARHAPGLKTFEDALEIRRRILMAFEHAERETDGAKRAALLTFAVVGGGPTGVELAGALAELARHTLARDFRSFDPREARVLLVEGAERVLPSFPPELSAKARAKLERMGVRVRTGELVTDVRADGLRIGSEFVPAGTVLWAAGVQASPVARTLGAPLDRAGRVLVGPDLSVPGRPEVFVIGDAAAIEQDGKPVPGMAPAAMQMGRHAAENIRRDLERRPRADFRYRNPGALATIGRSAAVADFGWLRIAGFPAWVLWLTVHILFLIGFRNRLVVLLDWAWAYFSRQKSARVILAENGGAEELRPPAAPEVRDP